MGKDSEILLEPFFSALAVNKQYIAAAVPTAFLISFFFSYYGIMTAYAVIIQKLYRRAIILPA